MDKDFRTLKGYELSHNSKMTYAMEDYLEMIYRSINEEGFIGINKLADKLNVKPSSSSKMVSNLRVIGYVEYEKYGKIKLTKKGIEIGEYLLYRHNVLNKFFCLLNNSENELEQTEKIEHFINKHTIQNIEKLNKMLEKKNLIIKKGTAILRKKKS